MSAYPRPEFEETYDPEVEATSNVLAEVFGVAPAENHDLAITMTEVVRHYRVPLSALHEWIRETRPTDMDELVRWCESDEPDRF